MLVLTLLSRGSSSSTGSRGTTSGSSGGSGANVGKELGDVLSLHGLGEKTGPVRLNLVVGGLEDLAELLLLSIAEKVQISKNSSMSSRSHQGATYRDLEVSVVEEEGSVGASESVSLFLLE